MTQRQRGFTELIVVHNLRTVADAHADLELLQLPELLLEGLVLRLHCLDLESSPKEVFQVQVNM